MRFGFALFLTAALILGPVALVSATQRVVVAEEFTATW